MAVLITFITFISFLLIIDLASLYSEKIINSKNKRLIDNSRTVSELIKHSNSISAFNLISFLFIILKIANALVFFSALNYSLVAVISAVIISIIEAKVIKIIKPHII